MLTFFLLTTLLLIPIPVSADDLLRTDFQRESFSKTVDYFDYARALATLHGLPRPADSWHAYVYMTYVNKMGLKMLYAGLRNISLANLAYLTIPMQSLLLHYKTENNSRDVVIASSFLMLMGFNDTTDTIYPDSPDRNDTLWASFSFGVNLNTLFPNLTLPSFNSESEVYPLTHSEDTLTWKWGMKYTNLTALWITTHINDNNETNPNRPWGLATYDELTFNYTLTIDPETKTATISQDHVIGRIRDLWTFWKWFLIFPLYKHHNSTGCYHAGQKISNETVYQFLNKHNVKMSIVDFQTSIMLDRDTYSTSTTGQNVTDNEIFVSNSSISTYADDGEKIYDTTFGAKESYNLFNYTEDPTENTPHNYEAITRTAEIEGYTRNNDLFTAHKKFAKYLPLILVHMYPGLFQRAKETITNMTRADYLYLISYPNYSGYRIEHDPIHTIYFSLTTSLSTNLDLGGIVFILAIVGVIILAVALVVTRRNPKKQDMLTS